VHRLARAAFVGIEEEPEVLVAQHDWHGAMIDALPRRSRVRLA